MNIYAVKLNVNLIIIGYTVLWSHASSLNIASWQVQLGC